MITPLDVAQEIYPDDEGAAIALEAHIHVLRGRGWRIVRSPSATDPHQQEIE